jgi:hypothetical protein
MEIEVKTTELTRRVLKQLDVVWGSVDPHVCRPIGRINAHEAGIEGPSEVGLLECYEDGNVTEHKVRAGMTMYMHDWNVVPKILILK